MEATLGDRTPKRSTSFSHRLIFVAVLGLAVRVLFAGLIAPDLGPASDAQAFREISQSLVDGDGYSKNRAFAEGSVPTAVHPPGLPLVLAALNSAGLAEPVPQRLGLAFLSSLGVVLIGLAGRRAGGPLVGIVAASISAFHPAWYQYAGSGQSEALHLVAVPACLLLAYRVVDGRATARAYCALGAGVGLATLTRSESILLVLLLITPAVLVGSARARTRLRFSAAALAGLLIVLGPWVVRNAATFGTLTLSTNLGVTLVGANCDTVYDGERLGGFSTRCALGVAGAVLWVPEEWTDATFDRKLTEHGLDYMREHADRVPAVMGARVGRAWGVYAPIHQLDRDVQEGRHRPSQTVGLVTHWVLLALSVVAIVGSVPRVRRTMWPLFGVIIATTLTVALSYGSTRLRVGAEPAVAILAAIGAITLWNRFRSRHDPEPS